MPTEDIPKHILSKSSFLKGCQCPKALYFSKHRSDLRGEVSDTQQMIFDQGHRVGDLAKQMKQFSGGVDAGPIDPFHYQDSVVLTEELIKKGTKIIYEATFQFDKVLFAGDILVQKNGKWKLYEVKSSTEVKEVNILDASLQYYIITQSGIEIEDISIVYLNNEYVRKGDIDLSELFIIQSVKKEVLALQKDIPKKIAELKAVLASKKEPNIDIGAHCTDPYECDFISHCWKKIPEVSVFNLVRMNGEKKFELYNEGIVEFKQIPKDYPLSEGQRMQVESYLKQKNFIDKKEIKKFISEVEHPLIYFMDFETFNPGVPIFDNSKPYQQIPFQYSLHYKSKQTGEIKHSDFLAEAKSDPRIPFIEALLQATKEPGNILVYSSFEVSRLNKLASDFPQYEEDILERISRVIDLMLPFQKRWYYTPAMNGSYSIKSVLPALIPELSYADLEISDGGTASTAFASLYHTTDKVKVDNIRKNLKEYCKLDTFAMVKLLEHLEEI